MYHFFDVYSLFDEVQVNVQNAQEHIIYHVCILEEVFIGKKARNND